RRHERVPHSRRRSLADRTTAVADEKNDERARVVIVRAGEKRVAALDPVREAVVEQERERAIDRDRRRPRGLAPHLVHDLVSPEPLVARGKPPEHLPAQRRQPLRPRRAQRLRVRKGVGCTTLVIVARRGKNRHGLVVSSRTAKSKPALISLSI